MGQLIIIAILLAVFFPTIFAIGFYAGLCLLGMGAICFIAILCDD